MYFGLISLTKASSAIGAKTGIRDHRALYSTKEYKKVRVRYFTPDEDAWETANG